MAPSHSPMLALLCACCGRRPHDPPAERAPLIPPSDDAPTPQPRVVDQQKLKERLGSVVRSKEGKMVNVNAQFPFHLHGHGGSSSRSSRDVSGGSRATSPSPRRPLHKPRSTTSLRADGEDAPLHPFVPTPSAPVLNVRLVRPARSAQSTRGRAQRSGDPGRAQTPDLEPADASPLEAHPIHRPVDAEVSPPGFSIHDAGAVARSWAD